MRTENRLDILAEKQQEAEIEGRGRSLLAKVRKMQEDLEGISHTMDK